MIYWKLKVTDQSYEVSFQHINFVPCPMRFSCPAQGWYRENKSIGENWRVKMFAVAGYHAVVCDAFIIIYLYFIWVFRLLQIISLDLIRSLSMLTQDAFALKQNKVYDTLFTYHYKGFIKHRNDILIFRGIHYSCTYLCTFYIICSVLANWCKM